MPTEPPPEPPTEGKTPPPKPNRSPPVPKAVLDKESEPLPKRGPAPPKPVRGSPPLPLRGGQDEQGSSSPKEITDRRPSRGKVLHIATCIDVHVHVQCILCNFIEGFLKT